MMQPMVMQFPPFHIDEDDYKMGNIAVKATSPSGKTLPLQICQDSTGQFTTNFMPNEIGDWCICISSNNKAIKGSPFTVRVYDGSKVKVFGVEGGEDGKPVSFTVDTSKAGNGKLTVEVTKENGNAVQASINKLGQNYKVSFDAVDPGVYNVKVFYATVEVPGSPFQVTIVDSKNIVASGMGLSSAMVGKVATFNVDTGRAVVTSAEVTVTIHSSTGVPVTTYAKAVGAGVYEVNYIPDDIGKYTINVKYGDKAIPRSPFVADVFNLQDIRVTSFTKDVVVNKTAVLEFEAKNTGPGEPVARVNGGKQTSDLKRIDDRKYRVSFTPKFPGNYCIDVEMYGEPIPNSPFLVEVHDGTGVSTTLDCTKGIVRTPIRFDINTEPYKGDVKVQCFSPSRKNVPVKLQNVDEVFYNAEFLPMELGNYEVLITFEGNHIRGSPFLVPVANPGGVILSMKSRSIMLGQTFYMTADTTKAGPGDLAVRASGIDGPLPIEGNKLSSGMYTIAFSPDAPGQYYVEVDFDCKPLPESPLTLTVYDVGNIEVTTGDCSLIRVGTSKNIHVNTMNAGVADLQAKLTSPGNTSVPLSITGSSKTGFDINICPKDAGPHQVDLIYGGMPVPCSPITFMAFDTSKIKVVGVNDGLVGRVSNFMIDLNNSGEGELEVVVTSSSGKPIVNEVNALNPGKLDVCFVPLEGGPHFVDVTFNKETVPGSPFKLKVLDAGSIQVVGDGVERVPVNEIALFYVTGQDLKANDLDVTIRGPQNSRHIVANVSDAGTNKVKVEYNPRNVGEFQIAINYLGQPVVGSPFQVKVWDASRVYVSKMTQAFVGVESTFNIEMRDAGDGTVEISILDPSGQLLPNQVTSAYSGVLQVAYVPMESGLHNVMVEFNGVRVNGTPRQIMVVDANKVSVKGEGISSVQNNTYTNFCIVAPDATLRDIDVKITDPQGRDVVCNVVERGGNFRVDYTPTVVGNYMIDICAFNNPVRCSPFVSRVWDHKKVILADHCITPQAGCNSGFRVLVSEAGEGLIEVSITDPCGNLVPNQISNTDPGIMDVRFSPMKHGQYRATVLFNEKFVPGSPFTFSVIDRDKVMCKVPSNGYVPVKKVTCLVVTAPMAKMSDLEFQVIGPNENEVTSNVHETGANTYKLDFTPIIAGDYRVAVKYFDCPIPLSTLKAWDITKVYVGCIKTGKVGFENTFDVDVRDAGEGSFEVSIENCKGQLNENSVSSDEKVKGLYHVTTIPCIPGPHKVNVLFNGQHVKGSPFTMPVCDPSQVTISGEGLHVVRCNRPTGFHLFGPEALSADVHCCLKTPSGKEIKCAPRDGSFGNFDVDYTPTETGENLLYVKYYDEPIRDSPFMVLCWDPAKVIINCIRPSIVGRPNMFYVNLSDAGPGSLEVEITSRGELVKSTAQSAAVPGVVEVMFTPVNVENHMVNVRFNGEPIPGSPFTALVLDGSQAMAKGPGLDCVRVGQPTRFTVTATGVGCDAEVEVLVTAPSGVNLPCSISGSYQNGYVVEYVPVDAGEHCIRVVYADTEIKGSPFYPCAYDPDRVVLVDRPPFACFKKPVSFKVDASAAGPGKVSVSVQGAKTRPFVDLHNSNNNIYTATFTPVEAVIHDVSVRFNEAEITDSPFKCTVLDEKQMRVMWESRGPRPVGMPVNLSIDCKNNFDLPLNANVVDPFGRNIEAREETSGDMYNLQFMPMNVGTYVINVSYGCDSVPGSPFKCETYDVGMVKVMDLTRDGCIGDDVFFTVDTSEAGPGVVDVEVSCKGKGVPVGREKFTNKCRYSFKADCPCVYQVDVAFNRASVPGSPFVYCVENPAGNLNLSSGNNGCPVGVGRLVWAVLVPPSGVKIHANDCDVAVMGPYDERPIPSRKSNMANGHVKIEYTSTAIGMHEIQVQYAGQEVAGSPCLNQVFDPNGIMLEGSQGGEVGKKVYLDINTMKAGKAELEVKVTDPSNHEHSFSLDPIDQGYQVTYVPSDPGVYKVNVSYGCLNVPGCPVRQDIKAFYPATACGDGLVKGMVGKVAAFNVDTKQQPGELIVTIRGPCGELECSVLPLPDGNFRVEYDPVEAGTHTVDIYFNNQIVQCTFHPKISDPMRVCIMDSDPCWSQDDQLFVRLNQLKSIPFDTSNAGPGKLTVTIEGPDSNHIHPDIISYPNGATLKFIPKCHGNHVIRAYFNDCPTKVFPIIAICQQEVIDIILPPMMEQCQIQKSEYKEESKLSSIGDTESTCGCCNGEKDISCRAENKYGCCGDGMEKQKVKKMFKKPPPPSSSESDSDDGFDDPRGKIRYNFNPPIYISEAPPHLQRYEYEAPYMMPPPQHMPCEECTACNGCDGFVEAPLVDPTLPPRMQPIYIEEKPSYPFEVNASHLQHNVDLLPACDYHHRPPPPPPPSPPPPQPPQIIIQEAPPPQPQHIIIQEAPQPPPQHIIVDCGYREPPAPAPEPLPLPMPIPMPMIDENLVVVSGAGLSLVRCREQGCFVIDGKMAGPGVPAARLLGLKEEVPVIMERIDEQLYGCSYMVGHPGAYLLTIWWSDRQIPCSPIKITVLPSCDASQVNLRADCLLSAQVNHETSVVVDCRRAGIGCLKASVQGPSKLHHCEVDDRRDGTYEVLFKPMEIGSFCINVFYDETHVPGSPFNFKVNACVDASQVRVAGEGLKNGILATFDSSFAVDTRGAGQGQLNVKVRGKKGTFQVQMRKDPRKDRVVLCKFNPTEVGEYWLNVLWSGEHVPGSPFKVVLVDTVEEMKSLQSMGGFGQAANFYGSLSSDLGKNVAFQDDY